MEEMHIALFQTENGKWLNGNDIFQALCEVGADDCDVLFVQTDIVFGKVNRNLKRKELLGILSKILLELNVKTLILPTFTFSFPNGEVYDVNNSKTSMGVLIEYMRKMPEMKYRTLDPMLSVAVFGEDAELFANIQGNESLGKGSAFDIIHQMSNVKFLMFGAEFGETFTYVHYVEKMLDVPYRYNQEFTGRIIDAEGVEKQETWIMHTACGGVTPRNFGFFEEYLVEKGLMKRKRIGEGTVVCISEQDVYEETVNMIQNNPYYFLENEYNNDDLRHEYKYGRNGEIVTHC